MITYLLRRILLMIPTLLGITVLVFTVMALSPGGISPQALIGGMDMKPEERKALQDYFNKRYGLDKPAPVQYLRWLNNVSPIGFHTDEQGGYTEFSFTKGMDLGSSFQYGRPVFDILKERIPITLLLNLVTIPVTYFIAIAVGMKSAANRGSTFDICMGISMLALWSIPTMLAGVLLLGFFANVQYLQWFPTAGISSREALDMPFLPHWNDSGFVRGFLLDRIWHLILPVLCLSYGSFAALAKLTRTSILENLNSDYARTARAKGLSEHDVLWRHVFRNSLLPLITVSAGLLPSLLAGSLIVENIFSINGMGQLAVEAVRGRDRELVLSITWVSGFLTLIGYLIADFCYMLADPRVSYD
ncbi:MAG: ABC transporter permease [Gammaproteobacteria bacterium]|nr:ABC transporter permease [Gammaproteobacteria bacterium]